MSHSPSGSRASLLFVILAGVVSVLGVLVVIGMWGERPGVFAKTCSMGMACCTQRGDGGECAHSVATDGHTYPPGIRSGHGEMETGCACAGLSTATATHTDFLVKHSSQNGSPVFCAFRNASLRGEIASVERASRHAPRAPPFLS